MHRKVKSFTYLILWLPLTLFDTDFVFFIKYFIQVLVENVRVIKINEEKNNNKSVTL